MLFSVQQSSLLTHVANDLYLTWLLSRLLNGKWLTWLNIWQLELSMATLHQSMWCQCTHVCNEKFDCSAHSVSLFWYNFQKIWMFVVVPRAYSFANKVQPKFLWLFKLFWTMVLHNFRLILGPGIILESPRNMYGIWYFLSFSRPCQEPITVTWNSEPPALPRKQEEILKFSGLWFLLDLY